MRYFHISYEELVQRLNDINIVLPEIQNDKSLCYLAEEQHEVAGYCVTTSYLNTSYLIRIIRFLGERARLVKEYAGFVRFIYEDLNSNHVSLMMLNTSFRKCKPYSPIIDKAGLYLEPTGSYNFDIEKQSWERSLNIVKSFMDWEGHYICKAYTALSDREKIIIYQASNLVPTYLSGVKGFEEEMKDISVCAFDSDGALCGWALSHIGNSYLYCHNMYCLPEYRKDCIGFFMCISMAVISREIGRYHEIERIAFQADIRDIESYRLFFRLSDRSDSKVYLYSKVQQIK